jgi:outer membrane immunogenic protein
MTRRLSAASLLAVSLSVVGPAVGADLPVAYRAPVMVAAPYSWTGFYVGGNVGYAWGQENSTLGIADGPGAACHFCAVPLPSDVPTAQGAGSPSFSPNGVIGGGQFGYNWQISNWVYGFEVDYQALGLRGSVNNGFRLPNLTAAGGNCAAPQCVGNFASSMSSDWLFTARPRVGFAWDRTLLYATGGLAVTKISFSQTYADNVTFGIGTGGAEGATASKTVVGWTVGAGVEEALTNRWSVKAEYLYTQFGGLTAFGRLTDGVPGDFSNFANNVGQLSAHTLRAGINYKFSGP